MKAGFTIILFYKYESIADTQGFLAWNKNICEECGFKGRVIIAEEGINATLEGETKMIEKYLEALRADKTFGNFSDLEVKTSSGSGRSFPKLKIKIRPEIVSLHLGEKDFSPREITGTYLDPKELKKWYESGKDFAIIDMRNDYEFKVGHFKNSINPELENFRDLPQKLSKLEPLKNKTVLTVCTGGVRCEKASGFLKQNGFSDVYQLKGGMHKYMEEFPGEDFLGALYTFDGRTVMDFGGERAVVGACDFCNEKSENYINCSNEFCHKHFIACESCLEEKGGFFCSNACRKIKYGQNSFFSKVSSWFESLVK